MYQALVLDGLSFDSFSFQQDGLAAPEVDAGGGEVGDGLVVSQVIVMGDESGDLGFKPPSTASITRSRKSNEQALGMALLRKPNRPKTLPIRHTWESRSKSAGNRFSVCVRAHSRIASSQDARQRSCRGEPPPPIVLNRYSPDDRLSWPRLRRNVDLGKVTACYDRPHAPEAGNIGTRRVGCSEMPSSRRTSPMIPVILAGTHGDRTRVMLMLDQAAAAVRRSAAVSRRTAFLLS